MEKVKIDKIWEMDCLQGLKTLPDNYIQCCVTSPPYWWLRDYNVDGQLGLEETVEEYVDNLVLAFSEVRRVLKDDGTFWLNIGDCYWGSGKAGKNPDYHKRHKEFGKPSKNTARYGMPVTGKHSEIKSKDLIGIPWMLAFALRKRGWWLRQEIIWHKKNSMPEGVRDRCTRNHEHIFLLTKSAKYYYDADAIRTPLSQSSLKDNRQFAAGAFNSIKNYSNNSIARNGKVGNKKSLGDLRVPRRSDERISAAALKGANRRTVWSLPFKPFSGGHFATFPPMLPELCIKAGSKRGDIILDPFMGAGTTAVVAKELGRHYIGFELNSDYIEIARQRLKSIK